MSDRTRSGAMGDNLADAKAAGDAAKQAASQARQAGSEAVGHAKDIAYEAKDRATSLAGDVKDGAVSAAEAQKGRLADQVDSLAQSIHRSGEQLEGEQDWIAKLVERGADELGSLANTLRTNDLQSLVGSLDGLARRQPALFLGASVVAGFALARVGKVAVAGSSPSTAAPTPQPFPSPNSPEAAPSYAGLPQSPARVDASRPSSTVPAASAAASPLPAPGIIHERD